MPGTPVKTRKELTAQEKFLQSSENLTYVSIILSCNVTKESDKEYKSVLRLLPYTMDNAVAKHCSFDGEGDKLGFKDLTLWQAVQGAVLTRIETSDLKATENAVRSWLRNAPYRKQGDGSSSRREVSEGGQHRNRKKSQT